MGLPLSYLWSYFLAFVAVAALALLLIFMSILRGQVRLTRMEQKQISDGLRQDLATSRDCWG